MAPRYDDGVYTVTSAVVATPRRFYPLANTTASVRRDPLWAGVAIAALGCACFAAYGDLLQVHEQATLFVLCAVALIGGWEVCILRLDAAGHRGTAIFGRRARIMLLYRAIRDARMPDNSNTPTMSVDHEPTQQNN